MTQKPHDLSTMLAELVRGVVRSELDRAICELSPAEPAPALLDRQQLARELGCSAAKVDRLKRDGLPFVTLGAAGVPRYRLGEVISWLSERTIHDDDP